MRLLSLDFGSWSLKAVELEARFRRLDILDFHEVRIPLKVDDPLTVYKAALQQILSRLPSHPDRIVTSLPPASAALRFLPFPLKQRKKVEQMFRFELEDSVPFRLDESIVEHHYFKTAEGSLILAGIAPKSHISKHLDWLKSLGLEADWLTFDGMGLLNIALAMEGAKESDSDSKGPIAVVDIGHQKTNFLVLDKGIAKHFRTVTWGGSAITRTVALNMSVSLEAAEALKIKDLKLSAKPAFENELVSSGVQALTPFLTDLNHNIAAFRNLYKQEISELHLYGGTANLIGLSDFLEARTGIESKKTKMYESLEVKSELKKHDPIRFAESWGRALALGRKAPILFNFRKEELAKQTSLTEIKEFLLNPHILKLAQYLGTLAAILLIHVNVASYLADKESASTNDELKKVFQDTFRTVPQKIRAGLLASPEQLKKYIEQKNTELEEKLKMLSNSKTPALGIIRQISTSFPPGVRVDVNELTLDDRSFTIQGVLYEGDLSNVTENLKKIPAFSDIILQLDGQRFSYLGKVTGR